jgi:cation transport regulator ChaB
MCLYKRLFTPGWALQKYSEQVRDNAGEHTLAIAIALALAHNISSAAVSARAVAVTKFRQPLIVKQITVGLTVIER